MAESKRDETKVLRSVQRREASTTPWGLLFLLVIPLCTALGVFAGKEPGLVFWDEDGKGRIWLGTGEKGPGLTLYDEKGESCASLAVLGGGRG